MPALERDRWTWDRPSSRTMPLTQWYQVNDRMARGVWAGRSYVFGRAVTYGAPAPSDGMEYRYGHLAWHPDHPPVLTDGHGGDVIGTAVWTDDSARDGGLYALFEVPDEHLTTVVLAAMSGKAALSISEPGATPGSLSDQRRLTDVSLVPAGDVPGATVFAVATPYDLYVRDHRGDLVHAGEGPASFEPLPSVADIAARFTADLATGTELVGRSTSGLYVPLDRLELRYAKDSGGRMLSGIAVPYDRVSYRAGARPEVVRFGAFAAATLDPGAVLLRDENHARDRRPAGVATKLVERRDGLHATFRMFDTPEGRSAFENALEQTYGGLSVGMFVTRERTTDDGVREILSADLDHVSLVDDPAYSDARIVTPADVAARVQPVAA